MRLTHHLAHLLKLNRSFYDPDRQKYRCKECVTRKFWGWTRRNLREWENGHRTGASGRTTTRT
jgi:hypothetical protein